MYKYTTFEEEARRKMIKGRVLSVLEFDKIISELKEKARTPYGGELAGSLLPTTSFEMVNESLEDTYEAYTYINKYGSIPLSSFPEIRDHLSYVRAGGVLTPAALLDIARFLRSVSELQGIVSGEHTDMYETNLFSSIRALYAEEKLRKEIEFAIVNSDEINDRASETLYSIRREKKDIAGSIRILLDRVIRNNEDILQEAIITIRNERYCVPVKSEHKGRLPGIVHDTSSTGQTVFIEPMNVVEANNRIRELSSMEKAEIERILASLTKLVKDSRGSLDADISLIGCIDLASAKGELAISMDAVKPVLLRDGKIRFMKARHPLLPKDTAVPVDIINGYDYTTLVITGPNTGGKTVSLKTCGLLTLMTMAGLMIPCAVGSEASVFDRVLADIGDEQSIEASLSTFSAHMSNIVFILKNVRGRSLVLLDELGSGTDPAEGAALAVSIFDRLFDSGCTVMATTHYKELKAYAITKDGVMNAACEFDTETLSPTYRLVTGAPGVSNAFVISGKLGLPKDIIEDARSKLSEEELSFEMLISEAEENSREAERLKDENLRLNNELKEKIASLEEEKKALKASKTKILNDSRMKQKELLKEKEEELDELMRELRTRSRNESREEARDELDRIRRRLRAGVKDLSKDEEEDGVDNVSLPGEAPKEVREGEKYFVPHLNFTGTVVSAPGGRNKKVRISSGTMTYSVDIANLRMPTAKQLAGGDQKEASSKKNRIEQAASYRQSSAGKMRYEKSMTVMPELMLIGKTVAEAESALDSYIDDCQLAGIHDIRIVHGKGTGALRSAVKSMLDSDIRVKSHRPGYQGEGDDGVTVAVLL
ncbi:MAG: endonuclease MutS2 [Clostridiales bacterium]|nr:endonuclease MutS2 [Clostridiales bacterium]